MTDVPPRFRGIHLPKLDQVKVAIRLPLDGVFNFHTSFGTRETASKWATAILEKIGTRSALGLGPGPDHARAVEVERSPIASMAAARITASSHLFAATKRSSHAACSPPTCASPMMAARRVVARK
jgi:hypothetical protein